MQTRTQQRATAAAVPPPRLTPELLDDVIAVPIGAPEYHAISYYLPLAVRYGPLDTPELCTIVAPSLVGYGLISRNGEWRPTYKPIAVRCLEAGVSVHRITGEGTSIAIALRGVAKSENGEPLRPTISEPMRIAVQQMHASALTLTDALDRLRLAGVLTPLSLADKDKRFGEFLTIDAERYLGLPRFALVALARGDFLAHDLAGAMLQSRRRLHPELRRSDEDGTLSFLRSVLAPAENTASTTLPLLDAADVYIDDSDTFG